MLIILKNEATATLRRMFFQIVDAVDGMTPELGEAGGQPQISVGGGAWANTTNTLVAIGNGRYYVELTQAEVNIADRSIIEGRYKSANTTETIGSTVQVLEFVPDAAISSIQNTLKIRNVTINDASPSKTKFITTLTETNNDYWNNGAILFTSGVNAGQIRSIKDYVGSTKEITLNTGLINTPSNGDAFSIVMLRAFHLAGLETQEIRDAMKLAPSAGDPGAGSIDKHLDDAALEATLTRALGLTLENHVEDDIVRDANGLKTSSIIYLYDSAAHATTHDKVTGLLAKYNVSVVYDSNRRLQKLTTVKA